jgi:hypothetical protein
MIQSRARMRCGFGRQALMKLGLISRIDLDSSLTFDPLDMRNSFDTKSHQTALYSACQEASKLNVLDHWRKISPPNGDKQSAMIALFKTLPRTIYCLRASNPQQFASIGGFEHSSPVCHQSWGRPPTSWKSPRTRRESKPRRNSPCATGREMNRPRR